MNSSSEIPRTNENPFLETPLGFLAKWSLSFIKLYQRWLSPFLGAHCRFRPSCSNYAFLAISRYGFFRGWGMGIYRILRCNPFNPGGEDPVV
ncbi:membrane protein insertion efficiency factor YidD [bacterium]|nr:membrane protein insertion efficiency factor YidD [bacterium]